MDWNKLADVLIPDENVKPLEYYEERYPERGLEKGAQVTRLAPSPTGFIHLGNLFVAIANERIAHQSGGLMYLRIEDTDLKRKVDGAVEAVKSALRYFDIRFDEGAEIEGAENAYGPYYQRERAEIYHAYAKDLIRRGLAYPCFCTEEALTALREKQTEEKKITGYYGEYATCRNLTEEEIYENLKAGKPYVIRLRSQGNAENKLTFRDEIKGDITVTENDQDVVILKSDGIPTYHFAHAIDDHFMRTTLVIRGEEWLASLPIHIELFDVLGFRRPKYGHNCSLQKMDGDTRRKLSKRKDPELSLEFYRQEGYFSRAVKVYMLTLLNSNFEEWYMKNPEAALEDFKFSIGKMGKSGTLFDLDKLNDISKNELARLSVEETYAFLSDWANEYMEKILNLCMGTSGKKRRKDFTTAKQAVEMISYFFDSSFAPTYEYRFDSAVVKAVLEGFKQAFDYADDCSAWFDKVKTVAAANGFATDMKAYKADPTAYPGNVSDVAEMLRIATTGLANTPDLWTIMQILGNERTIARLDKAIAALS